MKLNQIILVAASACSNQPEGPFSSQLLAQGCESPTSVATPDKHLRDRANVGRDA